jgi:cytochrome c5
VNQQDKAFMTVFGAVLGGLVVLAVVIFIIAQLISGSSLPEQDQTERLLAQAEERIRPVGQVVVAGSEEAEAQPAVAADAEMTAEQVYNSACAACHAAGVLEAPVTGDNAVWSERYQSKGMQTLLDHAINGFNQMPARGGNANLSDRNVHDAIVFMLQQSDIEVAAADLPATDSAAADESSETSESPESTTGMEATAETSEQAAAEATDTEQQANADSATAEEQAAVTDDSADQATTGTGDDEATQAGISIPDEYDAAQGEQTYNQVCMVCHAQGVAGAPKLGDHEAWEARLAQGWETLQQHTLQGFNAMPAKGGRPDLPDDEILNSLAYMIEQSQ